MWEAGYVDVTATEALQAAAEHKSPGARDEAKQFLLTMLAGGPVPVKEINDAAEAAGISWRTVERVKNGLRGRNPGPANQEGGAGAVGQRAAPELR